VGGWNDGFREDPMEDLRRFVPTLGQRYCPEVTPDRLYSIWKMPRRTIISQDGWEFNLAVDDRAELYDLNADPYELTNVVDSPQNRDRILEMAGRHRAWLGFEQRPGPRNERLTGAETHPGKGAAPLCHLHFSQTPTPWRRRSRPGRPGPLRPPRSRPR